MPNPPDALQKTVFQFVWNRKKDRISRKVTIKTIAKGGLGIPDIRHYINVLKLSWIRKLNTSDHKWKGIITSTYPRMLLLEQLGSSLPTQEKNFNMFWIHVFKAYREFGKRIQVENSEELVADPIFCNNNILVGNKTGFFNKKWIDKSVCFIKNILNENGTFMLFKRFKEIYRINTGYITYIGRVQAIKSYICKTGLTVENNSSTDLTKMLKIIYSQQKGSRLYYEMLTQGKDKPKCCEKWKQD